MWRLGCKIKCGFDFGVCVLVVCGVVREVGFCFGGFFDGFERKMF